jgi:hypothetical protein
VVALQGLGLVAHGGIYGAFAEAALGLALGGFFVWIWLRERRKSRTRGDGPAEMNEDAPDQRGGW